MPQYYLFITSNYNYSNQLVPIFVKSYASFFYAMLIIIKSLLIGLILWITPTCWFNNDAQTPRKAYTIKISGNCEHCKERIETALDIDGVKSAHWSEKTGLAKIIIDTTKISIITLEQAVSKVGHDTPNYKAAASAYSKLPKCCHYTRDPR